MYPIAKNEQMIIVTIVTVYLLLLSMVIIIIIIITIDSTHFWCNTEENLGTISILGLECDSKCVCQTGFYF